MAEIALRAERAEHTLQATALVHEAYMRLFGSHQVEWQSRQQKAEGRKQKLEAQLNEGELRLETQARAREAAIE